jgi:Outer membrane protein
MGKTYYGEKQAQKNVSRLAQEYLNLENEAAFEVKKNFLQIREAEKRIAAAKQGLIAAKESYRMAVARYEAQVGTNTDVLDAQSGQTLSEASLNGALAAYEQAVAALYGSMGLEKSGAVALVMTTRILERIRVFVLVISTLGRSFLRSGFFDGFAPGHGAFFSARTANSVSLSSTAE